MSELTLEALAQRVDAIERSLQRANSSVESKDWNKVVGMFGSDAFMKRVDEEGRKLREAERNEARNEQASE